MTTTKPGGHQPRTYATPASPGGAPVTALIEFGDSSEDQRYVVDTLDGIIAACRQARDAYDAAAGRAELVAALTGAATLLGLAPIAGTAIAVLRASLIATRDAESEISEG